MDSETVRTERVRANIAPWLSVAGATEAVGYYKAAFDATESYRLEDDAGEVAVAQLSVDGADFWVQEDPDCSPESVGGRSVRMILTVEDPDAVFARAVAAGGTEVAQVSDSYGWHVGRMADPFGHHWEVGRPLTA